MAILFQTSLAQSVNKNGNRKFSEIDIQRTEPPFWWVGFEDSSLDIVLYGHDLTGIIPKVNHEGVKLISFENTANPNYLFLHLEIDPTCKPGSFIIELSRGKSKKNLEYRLLERTRCERGLQQNDLIYLIMPDRFANGDPDNDIIDGTQQASINRDSMFHRHGGDIKGITAHLDYLEELGVTALWLNPTIANDQPYKSYHGYAATDLYATDPRLGSNQDYLNLCEAAKKRGIKMVMDVVYNHWGDQHWMIKDLPDPSWIHVQDSFLRTTYRETTMFDPHASEADRKLFADGWFDTHMPDLNQNHHLLAKYLIQNTLWWVEYASIEALRVDTYAYPDQRFMSDWGQAVLREFPDLSIFGETWVHGTSIQAWFTDGNGLNKDFRSNLPAVTDFQLHYAINKSMNEPFGWTEGVNSLYYTLAKDFLYTSPEKNVIFLDNHDLSRFYSVVGEDKRKLKAGLGLLFTLRGIPQLYYGTEILLKNYADPDGKVRQDFPGGWPGDRTNKFVATGRNAEENELFDYVKKLANWRKDSPAIAHGELMQFVPEAGVYVFFRYCEAQTIMVVLNASEQSQNVDLTRFKERFSSFTKGVEILNQKQCELTGTIDLEPFELGIFELK